MLFEKLLRIGNGTRLKELESGHYVSYDSHNSPLLSFKSAIKCGPSADAASAGPLRATSESCRRSPARAGRSRPQRIRRAFKMEAHPPPTGGSPTPRAPTGVSGSGISSAVPLHVRRAHPESSAACCGGSAWKPSAVVRIEHPLLADRMADAQRRAAEHLAAQRAGMNHRADIAGGEKIHDVVLAGFDIDFDFGKAGDVGKCLSRRADSCPWPPPPGPGPPAPRPTPSSICGHRRAPRGHRRCRPVESRISRPAPKSCPRRRPCGRRARWRPRIAPACRRVSWPRFPGAFSWRPSPSHTRRASSRGSSGCRRRRR
jgi:hypothetical protein